MLHASALGLSDETVAINKLLECFIHEVKSFEDVAETLEKRQADSKKRQVDDDAADEAESTEEAVAAEAVEPASDDATSEASNDADLAPDTEAEAEAEAEAIAPETEKAA